MRRKERRKKKGKEMSSIIMAGNFVPIIDALTAVAFQNRHYIIF